MHNDPINPFDPAEPRRDEELAALLRTVTGDVPMRAVDWDALASRISRSIPSRTAATWWSYAQRWERRMLPLALAASLVGAVALWNTSSEPAASAMVAQIGSADIVEDFVHGTPVEDAARTYARSVTSEMTIADTGTE